VKAGHVLPPGGAAMPDPGIRSGWNMIFGEGDGAPPDKLFGKLHGAVTARLKG